MNCVSWTLDALVKRGVEIPLSFNDMTISDLNKIDRDRIKFLKARNWDNYFSSFLKVTNKPKNWDIISTTKGVGFYMNGTIFSISFRNIELYGTIPKKDTIFYKVNYD